MIRLLSWSLFVLLALIGPAVAQSVEVSREDVGRSFLLFEEAAERYPPPASEREAFGRQWDHLARLAFRNRWPQAVRELARATDALLPPEQTGPGDRAARATGVRFDPPVPKVGQPVQIRLAPLFDVEDRPERLTLTISGGDGQPFREQFETSGDVVVWPGGDRRGAFDVRVRSTDGEEWTRGQISVVDAAPTDVREALARQLDEATLPPDIAAAADATRGRLDLLRDDGDPQRPPSFVADAGQLIADLTAEVTAVVEGVDPFAGKTGTYWTTLAGVPAIVHAPAAALAGGDPMPIVFALHGAGGDENLFVLGYGAGALRKLADERGFLLVSPRTYPLLGHGERMVAMLDELAGRYPIDQSRVYALGHSLGAITIAGWTLGDADGPALDVLAAVGLIAGGGRPAIVTRAVPTFLAAAGRDRIFRVDRLRDIVDAVRALDVPAAFEVYEDEAHVSVVRRSIDDVVAWLLEQRRAGV